MKRKKIKSKYWSKEDVKKLGNFFVDIPFPDLNHQDENYQALLGACINNRLDILKILLKDPRFDPGYSNSYILSYSCERGFIEIVKFLLEDPRIDPGGDLNAPIRKASRMGHDEIVKMLLKDRRVDPNASKCQSLRFAARTNRISTLKILLSDHRLEYDTEMIDRLNEQYEGAIFQETLDLLYSIVKIPPKLRRKYLEENSETGKIVGRLDDMGFF